MQTRGATQIGIENAVLAHIRARTVHSGLFRAKPRHSGLSAPFRTSELKLRKVRKPDLFRDFGGLVHLCMSQLIKINTQVRTSATAVFQEKHNVRVRLARPKQNNTRVLSSLVVCGKRKNVHTYPHETHIRHVYYSQHASGMLQKCCFHSSSSAQSTLCPCGSSVRVSRCFARSSPSDGNSTRKEVWSVCF